MEHKNKQTERDLMECKKFKLQCEKHVIREVTLLEQHLVTRHHLLVRMFTLADKLCNNHIHMNDMLNVFSKLKIPVSQATAEVLLGILVVDDDGLVNYIQLLRGGISRKVQEYFQQLGSKQKDFNDINKQNFVAISRQLQLEKHNTLSSISGRSGVLASENQEEELLQFTALLDYCRNNGVILDWKLAEQGNVHTCISFRQPTLAYM